MANFAIKGHATRGKEVIKILEMLGEKNVDNYKGNDASWYYIIRNNEIDWCHECTPESNFISFTLEEFLEKFPYKVGDKVLAFGNKWTIVGAVWDRSIEEVVYTIKSEASGYTTTKLSNQLQPYKEEAIDKAIKAVFDANVQCCDIMNHLIKEETMEEIKIDIPKGYEFAGVDDNRQQVVFTKIGYHYPKTYDECCKVLFPNAIELGKVSTNGYNCEKLKKLGELLICRDAYWQIAGEQMGLGKPWEPDWENFDSMKHCIGTDKRIVGRCIRATNNKILSFPTEEMRDAFYENFKELIEECKDLL